MESFIRQIKCARRVSVPLIAVGTPDPCATIEQILEAIKAEGDKDKATPVIAWDIITGTTGLTENGKKARAVFLDSNGNDVTEGNPVHLLRLAQKLPDHSILCVHLSPRWMVDPQFIQAIWNLRDTFKSTHRMLVLLGASVDLPPEIAGDAVAIDEPLPGADQLLEIAHRLYGDAKLKIDGQQMPLIVEAVLGLPAFQAEQIIAMSLGVSGIALDALWERKRRQIELTPGLKVNREGVDFERIGGVSTIKQFLSSILTSAGRPNAIVFVDEIEKFMAGASGDSSGVSQDQLGTLLSYMQDNSATGCIFVGPPGSAKSAVAKAAGNHAGIPTIQIDLGAMKGSLVGQSEQHLRSALKVITSVSNGKSLWIATSNSISDLPPELRRRFTLGTYFFDLPTAEERAAIWKIWKKQYELSASPAAAAIPDDDGWTGAEIRQCCDIAWRLGCTLREAAKFVVPISVSAADQVDRLRKSADGKFLSANRPGVYRRENTDQPIQSNGKSPRSRAMNLRES